MHERSDHLETRLLEYFLTVAETGNITKAAAKLHLTQPTLSRQIMELEQQLGTKLFIRGKRQLALTTTGLVFEKRARELLGFWDQTKNEIQQTNTTLVETLKIGCVETSISPLAMQACLAFHQNYPAVNFAITDADGNDIKERLDQNDLELGFLIAPIEVAKYNYLTLKQTETWGIVVRKTHRLATKTTVTGADLKNETLLLPKRGIVRNELKTWLKALPTSTNILGTNNLLGNVTTLARQSDVCLICVKGAFEMFDTSELVFIPFAPLRHSKHILAWRKNVELSLAAQEFIEFVKNNKL